MIPSPFIQDIVADRVCVRVDPDTDVRQEIGFFGQGPSEVFGSLHVPSQGARAGVLICSPLQSEFLANYRREVLLARVLAARGIAVARFQYRGTGHSDGHEREVTIDTMRQDALEAVSWLCDRASVDDLGFMGTRWGALIAAGIAAESAGRPVAVWDPVIEGSEYFREVFRFRQMSQLSHGKAGSRDVRVEMRSAGYADVFGFRIDRAIFESAEGHDLSEELGWLPRPVLLVQVDRRMRLMDEYAKRVAAWRQAGLSVDVRLFEGQEAWWFPGAQWRETALERSEAMVNATANWFAARLAPAANSR